MLVVALSGLDDVELSGTEIRALGARVAATAEALTAAVQGRRPRSPGGRHHLRRSSNCCRALGSGRDGPTVSPMSPASTAGRAGSDYIPPLSDMRFVLENVVDLAGLATLPGYEHADPETVAGVLEEAGRLFTQEFAPLNRIGDAQHSRRHDDGTVTMPEGFIRAYRRYVEGGWAGVPFPAEYGGGGFPWLVAVAMQEMLTAANMAFSLCPFLTQGAIDMLLRLRLRGPARDLPAQDGHRRVDRHHEPDRVQRRIRRRRPHHQGRPRRGRDVAHHRPEDLHQLRRARPRREHRAPGAGPGAGCAARHQGHLVLHRSEVPGRRRRLRRRAQRRGVRVDRAEDGHQRQPHVRDGLRRAPSATSSASPTRACATCSR